MGKIFKKQKGFTLIEALVATFMFSLALVAVLRVTGESTVSRVAAERTTIGEYLAQNAFEVVRNIRDTNFISGDDWLTDIDHCLANGCTYNIATSTPELIACSASDCQVHVERSVGYWFVASSTQYGFGQEDGDEYHVHITYTESGSDEINVNVRVDTMYKGSLINVVDRNLDFYRWYQTGSSGDALGVCEETCGIEQKDGRTIVSFNTKLSQWTTGIKETGPATVSLAPGNYDVFVQSYDSEPTRASDTGQVNERWFVRFYGPGGFVLGDPDAGTPLLESGVSTDLTDGVETACLAEAVNRSVAVPSGIVEVTAVHNTVNSGNWDSLDAVCAAFDKLD